MLGTRTHGRVQAVYIGTLFYMTNIDSQFQSTLTRNSLLAIGKHMSYLLVAVRISCDTYTAVAAGSSNLQIRGFEHLVPF